MVQASLFRELEEIESRRLPHLCLDRMVENLRTCEGLPDQNGTGEIRRLAKKLKGRLVEAVGNSKSGESEHKKLLAKLLSQVRDIGTGEFDTLRRIRLIAHLGGYCSVMGDLPGSLNCYREGVVLSEAAGQPATQAGLLLEVSQLYSSRGYLELAETYLKESLRLGDQHGWVAAGELARVESGTLLRKKGQLIRARDLLSEVLSDAMRRKSHKNLAEINIQLGQIESILGEHNFALANFQNALTAYQSGGDQLGMARVYNHLGRVNTIKRSFRDATQNFEKSLRHCQGPAAYELVPLIYFNKGSFFLETGDLPMAVIFTGRALERQIAVQNPVGFPKASRLLGVVLGKNGEMDGARRFFEESFDLYRYFGNRLGLARAHYQFARVCMENDLQGEANTNLARSRELYAELGIKVFPASMTLLSA